MLTELKGLINNDKTQNQCERLDLTIDSTSDLKQGLEFLREHFSEENPLRIKKLTITFKHKKAAKRSKLAIEAIEMFDFMAEMEAIEIYPSIKDYALRKLFNLKAFRNLDTLNFTHEIEGDHPVNSLEFFNNTLVNYLNTNQNLKELTIENYTEHLTAKNCSKLKEAMIKHPKLEMFSQSTRLHLNCPPNSLSADRELTNAFSKKVVNTPYYRKAARANKFQETAQKARILMIDLAENIKEEKPIEWKKQSINLKKLLKEFKGLNLDYQNDLDGEDSDDIALKQSQTLIFIKYLTLLDKKVDLTLKKQSLSLEEKDCLEEFWNVTNAGLAKNIRKKLLEKTTDFASDHEEIDELLTNSDLVENINTYAGQSSSSHGFFAKTGKLEEEFDEGAFKNNYFYINNIKPLLNKYTDNNSFFMRVIRGHWNHHHIEDINNLIKKVNKQEINSLDDFFEELNAIKLKNKNGTLSKYITILNREVAGFRATDGVKLD